MKNDIKKKIINYLLYYEPKLIGIFGSYARNEQSENSDLDILVSFKKRITLIDLSKITSDLTNELNIKIDLVTQNAIHPKIKPYIEQDLQIIYNA